MCLKASVITTLAVCCLAGGASAAPYRELTPDFDRKKSRTMVRKIKKPTPANLDYAAYDDNPVLFDPQKQKYRKPDGTVGLDSLTFSGVLSEVCNSLDATPLSREEKQQPLAWSPLIERLWKHVKDPGFQQTSSMVNGHKWADPNVIKPYQKITTAYVHLAEDGSRKLWVKVEFAPWVGFLEGITDEDDDGFKEIYGLLSLDKVEEDARTAAFDWILNEYTVKELSYEEIRDWITVLASYWYPTYNTDVIDMGEATTWPTKEVSWWVRRKLKGVRVENPIAVVRGNPLGKKIYNVYVVEGLAEEAPEQKAAVGETAADKQMDTTLSENFRANNERFAAERHKHGGYAAWRDSLDDVFAAQENFLAQLPPEQMGFEGKEDWVFFRKSLEYTTGGDLTDQPRSRNALPHLKQLREYLAGHDVNLLFVVVPTKAEVYYEKLPFPMPSEPDVIINPYLRKFLSDVQEAGIEVIDVLPRLLAAKTEDNEETGELYQRQDTHWTNRGLQIVADLVARRIRNYGWYEQLDPVDYTVVDTTFQRQGDIVSRLPEKLRASYPPVQLRGRQVRMPDGKPYRGNRAAPLMLIGDSFTGVFESVDCKSAGVGAHIAEKSGIPVDIITSWGGGPLVRRKMMRARSKDMGVKRLVVYLMVARDLYDYSQGWKDLDADKR